MRAARATSPSITDVLRARAGDVRTCVPVIGSGVNLQAARSAGHREDDWAGLLARIAEELRLPSRVVAGLPAPHLFRWEAMLRLWARIKRVEPYQAENELQAITCSYLRSVEAHTASHPLYREIAGARFADIISLNFDRRVALSAGRRRFISGPAPCPEGSHGEALYRHDRIDHGGGAHTRVWYPHGDTKKATTLKLGVRKYGFYVGSIAETYGGHGETWRYKRAWNQWNRLSAGHHAFSLSGGDGQHARWVTAFTSRPLVFLGCGLSPDEWPLWSMLRRRAQAGARRRPAAYVLIAAPPPADQARALAELGVTLLTYRSFDALWDDVRAALAEP